MDTKRFEAKVKKDIIKCKLAKKGQKIVAACSGGKDSTTVLHLLDKFGFEPEALIIDLSKGEYFRKNLNNLKSFCSMRSIKLHSVSFYEEFGCPMCRMSAEMGQKHGIKSCSFCGVMKRYLLNRKARQLGADAIAFGHNLDDEAQSVLMNLMNGNTGMGLNLGPITRSRVKGLIPRVKPLCFVEESEVAAYSKAMKFPVIYEKCPCSFDSFRKGLREGLNTMEERHPGTKLRLLEGYLAILPELRSGDNGTAMKCAECGEPSRNRTCNACMMLGMLKK